MEEALQQLKEGGGLDAGDMEETIEKVPLAPT
jgi:hypothetical protein